LIFRPKIANITLFGPQFDLKRSFNPAISGLIQASEEGGEFFRSSALKIQVGDK
jgi:hypothetical protein